LGAEAFARLFSSSVAYTQTKMGSSTAEAGPGSSINAPGLAKGVPPTTCRLLAAEVSLAECECLHMQGLHASALEKAGAAAEGVETLLERCAQSGEIHLYVFSS